MVRASSAIVLAAAIGLTHLMAVAEDSVDSGAKTLAEQRAAFLEAEKALLRGDHERFSKLKEESSDYVLYPYLEYWELRRYLSQASSDDVDNFIKRFPDTPMVDNLRSAWLRLLARREQWAEYLKFHKPTRNTSAQCRELLALIKTGKAGRAYPRVKKLWLVGHSQPRACDPLFTAWRDAGHLNSDLVWQRISLSMKKGNAGLARYLAGFLEDKDRHWVDLWREVYKKPKRILDFARFRGSHPMREAILVYGVERLARKDALDAVHSWKKLQKRYRFTPAQRIEVDRAIVLRMARSDHPEAVEAFRALSAEALDDEIHEWRVRSALQAGDWKQALEWIKSLPDAMAQSERYRYWRGRCLEELGQPHGARKYFAGLSLARSYYGFLAADRLGVGYRIDHEPLPVTESEVEALKRIPGMGRAYELLQLDRTLDARREWRDAIADMNKRQLMRAAKLAHSWQWHDRAIATVAKAHHWDDLDTRFPLAHAQRVSEQAGKRGLDVAWVFALLRQESAFAEDARSPAGAMGLMQLMPRTAKSVAKELKTRLHSKNDLLSADLNIRLGTAYLRGVYDRFDDNMVLATAAYNAGPHRVSSWLPEQGEMAADVWVESIPFRETRDYVRRVLTYTAIYEQRLGRTPTRLQERMHSIGKAAKRITQADVLNAIKAG